MHRTLTAALPLIVLALTVCATAQFYPRENDFAVSTEPFGSEQSTTEYASAPASMQVAAPWLLAKSTGWPYFVNAPVWFDDSFPRIAIRIRLKYKYGPIQTPSETEPNIYVMVMKDAAAADQNGRFVGRAYLVRAVRNTEWLELDTVIADIREWVDPDRNQTIGELHTGGNVQLTLCFQPGKSSLFIDDLSVSEDGSTSVAPLAVAHRRPSLGGGELRVYSPNGRTLTPRSPVAAACRITVRSGMANRTIGGMR